MENTSSSITSVATLTSEQKAFILRGGVSPKDESGVRELTRGFSGEFDIDIPWGTMRRILTNLQRKDRRNGRRVPVWGGDAYL